MRKQSRRHRRSRSCFFEPLEQRSLLAAVDYLLEIDGIKGESGDSKHPGAIEIESFSWGAKGSTNAMPDKTAQEFHFVLTQNVASPTLFQAAVNGKHFPSATLIVRKPDNGFEYLKIKLSDVLVSSVRDRSLNEGLPEEEITLNFAKVQESYRATNPDGSASLPITASWTVSTADTKKIPGASLLNSMPSQDVDLTDAFLAVSGIKGESQDAKHAGTIEIESFSWGVSQSSSASGGGGGAGKVSMQDIHFVMNSNKASPSLAAACASGKHIPEATLFVRKAGSTSDYFTIKLQDVLVSSYQTQGTDETVPEDEISLNFTKATQTFVPQNQDGSLGTPVTGVFNGGLVPAVHVAGPSILSRTVATSASQDYFLSVNGIKGESQDDKHAGTIEISSFSWGMTNSGGSAAGGGGGAGKVAVRDFSFTTPTTSASPLLMAATGKGTHFTTSSLFMRKSGGKFDYLTIKLNDLLVSSYHTQDLNDDLPVDRFSLNFAKLNETSKVENPDGSVSPGAQFGLTVGTHKAALAAPVSPGVAQGAVDAFLTIDGIKGESTDDKHAGAIEISSFSWGLSQTSSASGGGGAGKASLQDIHFVAKAGKASPQLLSALTSGKHITNAIIAVRKAGGTQEYLKIKLSDILVSSIRDQSTNGQAPLEEFTLNFAKIEYSYAQQSDAGGLLTPVKGTLTNASRDTSKIGNNVIGLTQSRGPSTQSFLNLAGIPGASTDDKHSGQIEIESFSWGATATHGSGGGGGTGKVVMQDFHFVTKVSSASPLLEQKVVSGRHLIDGTLSVSTRTDGSLPDFDYLKIKLVDVLVSSYHVSGNDSSTPLEEFTLNFARIAQTDFAQAGDGSVSPASTASVKDPTTADNHRFGSSILGATKTAEASQDFFLLIDGIKGESTDDKHSGQIEISSFSWGLSQTVSTASGGGGGAGKVSMQDFHFTTQVNKATPLLMLALATGQHIKTASFTLSDSTSDDYMKWGFTDLTAGSIGLSGHDGIVPVDTFSLNFAKVQQSFDSTRGL